MINRREFFGMAVGAGAALTLPPRLLRALQQPRADLIQRAIPSTGEKIPVIGLSFSNHPVCADQAALKEVLRAFADNGGTVFDVMHASNAGADRFHTTAATELGIREKLFWSMRGTPAGGPPQPGAAVVNAQIDSLLTRTGESHIDLVMLPPQGDPSHLAALKEEKKAGRVRYIGVQVIADPFYTQLESVMRNEPIDFIGVDYDVGNRAIVEDTILPLAQERNIAVMAFFPFGNNRGVSCGSGANLFARVGNRPVPEWAADFDVTTWAQFFLKYVISHPAITVARVGTSKPAHMLDNMAGGVGRLPDEATRKRMAAFIDALPEIPPPAPPAPPVTKPAIVLSAAVLDRYVGEYRTAGGTMLIVRRDGATLMVKPGPNPEGVIHAQTGTRFADPRGPMLEFQLDSAGNVTGVIVEQGTQKIPASRVR